MSAMATRKCGNIYLPKYFVAVRPFLSRNFFKNYLGRRGQNISLQSGKFSSGAQSEDLIPSLTIQELKKKKNPGFICSVCVTFWGSCPVTTEGIRVSWTSTDVRRY